MLVFGVIRDRLDVPDGLAARVADGRLDPYEAANELLAGIGLLARRPRGQGGRHPSPPEPPAGA
jgi:hypothetical protein